MGPIRSRIISVFLFVRSSRVHFAENCGERQGRSHEKVGKSEVRFADNRWKWELPARAVERDSLRSPYGPPLAVQNAGVLSNPVEASHPSRRCAMQKKSLDANPGFLFEFGGERGVRTLDTLSRIHTFQACSFSHSDTSPFCCRKRFALSTGANVGESDLSVNPLISFS